MQTEKAVLDTGAWTSYPRELVAARRRLRSADLSYTEYVSIEDRLAAGLSGDARRFATGSEGFARSGPAAPLSVVDKLCALPCPAVDEFAYVSASTELDVVVTLPLPEAVLSFWNASDGIYSDHRRILLDARAVIAAWTRELTDAGCRRIELGASRPTTDVAGLIPTYWTTQKAHS